MAANRSTNNPDFCGASIFWDLNLTWYNSYPGFTGCFQDTILLLAPCVWLWLLSLLYIFALNKAKRKPSLIIGGLNITKCIISACLVISSASIAIKSIIDHNASHESSARADVVSPFIRAATMFYSIILIRYTARKGEITSGYLFLFWLLEFVTGIIPFYSNIIEKKYDLNVFHFVVLYVDCACVTTTLILHCFAEKRVIPHLNKKKPCPELNASFINQVTFGWMLPILVKGCKRPLVESDIADLNPIDKSAAVVARFQAAWAHQVQKYGSRSQINDVHSKSITPNYESITQHNASNESNLHNTSDENSPLLRNKVDDDTTTRTVTYAKKNGEKSASVIMTLFTAFGWDLLRSNAYKLVYDVLLFVNPLLLSLLINFVDKSAEQVAWKGYVYAALIFTVTLLQTAFYQHCQLELFRVGMKFRTALVSAVYRKALTMSNLARKESTVGEIINLMSVDSQRFLDIAGYFWALWSGPLQVIVAIVFLYMIVGYAVFAGVGVLVAIIPLNVYALYKMNLLQEDQMDHKDDRIKLITEVLNGIKVLKLYAWEESFQDQISAIRQRELDTIRKIQLIDGISICCWTIAPFTVMLATFATYVYTNDAHFLAPDVAFVSINLFNILRSAINLFPVIIGDVSRALISLRRLQNFLTHENIDSDNVQHSTDEVDAVVMENASFQWDPELGPCLKK